MKQNQLGISGEPSKGIIYEDSDEEITLRYDPNTQFISFWEDGVKYDLMDCSFFSDWDSITKELYAEYGINLLNRVHHLGKEVRESTSQVQLRTDEATQRQQADDGRVATASHRPLGEVVR